MSWSQLCPAACSAHPSVAPGSFREAAPGFAHTRAGPSTPGPVAASSPAPLPSVLPASAEGTALRADTYYFPGSSCQPFPWATAPGPPAQGAIRQLLPPRRKPSRTAPAELPPRHPPPTALSLWPYPNICSFPSLLRASVPFLTHPHFPEGPFTSSKTQLKCPLLQEPFPKPLKRKESVLSTVPWPPRRTHAHGLDPVVCMAGLAIPPGHSRNPR